MQYWSKLAIEFPFLNLSSQTRKDFNFPAAMGIPMKGAGGGKQTKKQILLHMEVRNKSKSRKIIQKQDTVWFCKNYADLIPRQDTGVKWL